MRKTREINFKVSFFSIDIRRLEYLEIIPRISCLYWHPMTLKKGAKNGQKPTFNPFLGWVLNTEPKFSNNKIL